MLLETLFLAEQSTQTYSEDIEYSPPKDAVDSVMFIEFFADGSYPLSGKMAEDQSNNTHLKLTDETEDKGETSSASDSQDTEKDSEYGSLNTCDQTASSSTKSPNMGTHKWNLCKRKPELSETSSLSKLQLSGSTSPSGSGISHDQEKDMFLMSLATTENANKKLTGLVIRIIDRTSPILREEWDCLSQQDQSVLFTYLENIYGSHLTSKKGIDSLDTINGLLTKRSKVKRNEEKLKKTVKKINSMMMKTFYFINNLHHLSDEELEAIIFGAYFGQKATEGTITNIFKSSQGFSQSTFIKILCNERYTEDFEAILNTSYIPEFIRLRHEKINRNLGYIRRRLLNDFDKTQPKAASKSIKRVPWPLTEILEGVNLCQKLIEKSKSC